MTPTAEDLARDLGADLEFCAFFPPGGCPFDDDTFVYQATHGWPAAIRRALATEKFKAWVHAYLDSAGVPHHPPGSHGAEGCRIGDRMDWLMTRLRDAEAEVLRLREQIAGHCARIAAQSELLSTRAEKEET